MNTPTVGKVVWYWPDSRDSGMGNLGSQPMAATVAYVHNDHLVNLMVLDHFGLQHARTSVRLVQDDAERPVPGRINAGGACPSPLRPWPNARGGTRMTAKEILSRIAASEHAIKTLKEAAPSSTIVVEAGGGRVKLSVARSSESGGGEGIIVQVCDRWYADDLARAIAHKILELLPEEPKLCAS